MTAPLADCFRPIRRLWAIDGSHGFDQPAIADFQSRWGPVPAVLGRYFAELAAHDKLRDQGDDGDLLVSPATSSWCQLEPYQPVYIENQGVFVWAIRTDQADLDDPPVWVSADRQHWQLESEALSDFLVSMAFYHAAFTLPYHGDEWLAVRPEGPALIRQRYRCQARPLPHSWHLEFFGTYGDDSIVVANNGGASELVFAAASPAHFAELAAVLTGLG